MKIIRTSLEWFSILLFVIGVYALISTCERSPKQEAFRGSMKYQPDEHITTDEARLMMLEWEQEKLRAEISAKNEE